MLDLGLLKIFLVYAEGPNPVGPHPKLFHKPAGQSLHLLNLTCPKIIKILLFSTILTSNNLPESALDPRSVVYTRNLITWDVEGCQWLSWPEQSSNNSTGTVLRYQREVEPHWNINQPIN